MCGNGEAECMESRKRIFRSLLQHHSRDAVCMEIHRKSIGNDRQRIFHICSSGTHSSGCQVRYVYLIMERARETER